MDTGLRCSELCGLTLQGADLDVGELKVVGKGDRERTVPVGLRAVRALRRYRDHFRPPVERPEFFLNVEGRPLTVHAVELMARKMKGLASIPRLHIHLLRHTFAIHYLVAGGDVFSLQKILGHSTLEVTRMYVNMVSSQVKEKHRLQPDGQPATRTSARWQEAIEGGSKAMAGQVIETWIKRARIPVYRWLVPERWHGGDSSHPLVTASSRGLVKYGGKC